MRSHFKRDESNDMILSIMLNKIDLARIDLNLLVLFEVVLGERHVGRAAARLNLTSSAVSHGLGRLRRLLNDPLFVRTPKGVVPTARALELAAPIAEMLARVRSVVATAEPFDPATSTRRFTIGAPDGASARSSRRFSPTLRERAPGIDIALRQLLPWPGETSPERAWRGVFAELEARAMDVAVIPSGQVPARFHVRGSSTRISSSPRAPVIRSPQDPTLDRYCADAARGGLGHRRSPRLRRRAACRARGFAADRLDRPELHVRPRHRRRQRSGRRPAAAIRRHACGAVPCRGAEAPLALPTFQLNAVAPAAAMMDAGLAWMVGLLAGST